MFRGVVCLILLRQIVTTPTTPSNDDILVGGRYEPEVHTINNANPYQGMTVTEGHGKYPVIF